MSADYYVCANCGKTFPDFIDYYACDEHYGGCGRIWCSEKCAKSDGYKDSYCNVGNDNCKHSDDLYECVTEKCGFLENTSCNYCRNENFTDKQVLEHLLNLTGLTVEEVKKDMKNKIDGVTSSEHIILKKGTKIKNLVRKPTLVLKEDIKIPLKTRIHYSIDMPELEIYELSDSMKELIDDIEYSLAYNYNFYGLASEKSLTGKAIELKHKMLNLIKIYKKEEIND